MALRWGPFSSLGGEATWTGEIFWRNLWSLSLGLRGEWLDDYEGSVNDSRSASTGMSLSGMRGGPQAESKMKAREKNQKKEAYRQNIQILHDFLAQCAVSDALGTLKFEWVRLGRRCKPEFDEDREDCSGLEGPNPFLLEEVVGKKVKSGGWFSAPPTRWKKGMKEVWLGGVRVGSEDLKFMKARMEGLKRLVVWEGMATELEGKKLFMEGRKWMDVDLGLLSGKEEVGLNGEKVESMEVPLILDV
ncbi:MAG: hypothetical protein Q9190_002081 [Brigantiaea leucoxantha]